ncbi:MAG TPA: glycosyltransferase [Candidatus Baltobacteraceae bacterium]
MSALVYSIIIPGRNESARIESTLDDFAKTFYDSEIIVVLNGCTDATPAIVRGLRAQFSNIVVVEIEDAVGKGGAVRAGMLVAKAPVVAYVDADHATSAAELRRLCESLDGDGIVASRWCKGAIVEVAQPFARRIASRVFNALVRAAFGLRFTDTQCGAKVFRTASIRDVLPYVETSNFAFDVDLLFAMKNAGMNVREVPTVWRDVEGSRLNLVPASARMFAAIVRLRIRNSFLRWVVPAFDRLFPTSPMRSHSGLNILILNWRDPEHPQAGGAEKYLHEMARRWVASGHAVEWLTARFPGAASTTTIDGVRVMRVGNAMSVYALLPIAYLRKFRDRFDVVIDAENGIPFFSPLFSMKPKICLVFHVHQQVLKKYLPAAIGSILIWAESWLMPRLYRTSKFVTISNDTREAMHAIGIPRQSVDIVYSGVDAEMVPGTKSLVPLFAYVGRLKVYKRVECIIEAFSAVRAAFPNAMLHIAGDGDDRGRLEECALRLGLAESVVFEGLVSQQRKVELLQSAWAYVSASEIEGWGIGVIEANACGTPALVYGVPGLREAVIDGVSGLVIEDGSDLSPALLSIVRDEPLRRRLESGAVSRAREFSWDAAAQAMVDVAMHAVIGDYYGLAHLSGEWSLIKRVRNDGDSIALAKIPLVSERKTAGG